MNQVNVKPLNLSTRSVLIAALTIIVSAGIVDGQRKHGIAKAAAHQTESVDVRTSNELSNRSL